MVQFEFFEGQAMQGGENEAGYPEDVTPRRVPSLTPMGALKALLTSSDPRVLSALFDRIDLNGDGMVTADELAAFVAQSGMSLSRQAVEAIIRLGDRNGDGRIDTTEWEILAAVWADIASLRAELDVGGGQGAASTVAAEQQPSNLDTINGIDTIESSLEPADGLSDRWSTFGGALDSQSDAVLIPAVAPVPQVVGDTVESPKAPHDDQLHGSSLTLAQAGTPRGRTGSLGSNQALGADGVGSSVVLKDGYAQVEGHGSHSVWLTLTSSALEYHTTRHDLTAPIQSWRLAEVRQLRSGPGQHLRVDMKTGRSFLLHLPSPQQTRAWADKLNAVLAAADVPIRSRGGKVLRQPRSSGGSTAASNPINAVRPVRTASKTAAAGTASPTGRRTLPPKQSALPAGDRSPRVSPRASSAPRGGGGKRRTQPSPQPLKTSSPRSPKPDLPSRAESGPSTSVSPAQGLVEELYAAQETAARLAAERRRHSKGLAWTAPELEPEPEPEPEPVHDHEQQEAGTTYFDGNGDEVGEDAESAPSPPWTRLNVTAAPKVKVLEWIQQHANPRFLKKNRLVSGTRSTAEIAAGLRNAELTRIYRELLDTNAFATLQEKAAAAARAKKHAAKKKSKEQEMLKRAKVHPLSLASSARSRTL